MANQWFKFFGGEWLSDPKTLSLTACERSCWLTLLCYVSMNGKDGVIENMTEQMLMIQSGVSFQHEEWDQTKGVLAKFEKLGMVKISGETITVKNWGKRQESYLTNAERQARFREKSNAPRYKSNARIEENRIDKNRVTNTLAPSASGDEKLVADIIFAFKDVNPSYKTLFQRNPQRLAIKRMLAEFGEEKLRKIIAYLPTSNGIKFAPTITTPTQLENKMGDLMAFARKQKGQTKNQVVSII